MASRIAILTLVITCLVLPPVAGGHAQAPEAVGLYLVDSDEDYPDANLGNGICDTGPAHGHSCTLRAAIQEANRDGMASTIKFDSMMDINYPTLEALVEPFTVIDGSDQWDGTLGRPGVSVGAGGYTNGILVIQGNAGRVYGIQFGGGGSTGIVVSGSQNTIIGGTEPGQRNVFLMTDHPTLDAIGIEITGGASKTDVRGNYFGTWNGTSAIVGVGEYGLYLQSGGNTVRENLIVGHSEAGILCWSSSGNAYMDNIIGTNKYKNTALPNKVGIYVEWSDGNQIGPYNYIAGNTQEGIEIRHSDNNYVLGNDVGDSSLPNGGDGIYMLDANDNFLGFAVMNKVENNGGYGLAMYHSDNNHIQNNSFHANTKAGIYLEDSEDNDIGATLPYGKNVMSENGTYGVHLSTGADNNTVSGNHVGFGWTGAFDHGNLSDGVLIDGGASGNHIGGLQPGRGNWIGFNHGTGILIEGSGTSGNVVEGNIIGAPINWGWEAPNGHHGIGVYDGATGNWIGWNNTIVSSAWSGVVIVGSDFNVVWYNHIGTDGADVDWGNSYYGAHIGNSAGNQIIGNDIAYNGTHAGEPGVRVEGSSSTNNFISINSIHDNGGLGIDLVDGGNSNQPAPTVTAGGCATAISGTACTGCLVEIFSDAAEEGWHYEGSATADGTTGAFSWSGTPAGPKITATASSAFLGATSEFSAPYDMGTTCNGTPTASFTFTPSNPSRCTSVTFDASGSHDPEDPGSALQVRWDWNNDGAYETEWNTQKTASHTFTTTGVHTVRLQVMDSGGLMDATTRQVSVSGVECKFVFLPLVMRNLK